MPLRNKRQRNKTFKLKITFSDIKIKLCSQ